MRTTHGVRVECYHSRMFRRHILVVVLFVIHIVVYSALILKCGQKKLIFYEKKIRFFFWELRNWVGIEIVPLSSPGSWGEELGNFVREDPFCLLLRCWSHDASSGCELSQAVNPTWQLTKAVKNWRLQKSYIRNTNYQFEYFNHYKVENFRLAFVDVGNMNL